VSKISPTGLTHFDEFGRPIMVDVSAKNEAARTATASGMVRMNRIALDLVKSGRSKKGDAAAVAELAGILGAKKTADLIPLCHPLPISSVKVEAIVDESGGGVRISAQAKSTGRTGVEMEALTAVSIACLTLYDMLKAVDRAIVIDDVKLDEKTGGSSGDFRREKERD
jgi:cyclic pyranopterin phosphate synthase